MRGSWFPRGNMGVSENTALRLCFLRKRLYSVWILHTRAQLARLAQVWKHHLRRLLEDRDFNHHGYSPSTVCHEDCRYRPTPTTRITVSVWRTLLYAVIEVYTALRCHLSALRRSGSDNPDVYCSTLSSKWHCPALCHDVHCSTLPSKAGDFDSTLLPHADVMMCTALRCHRSHLHLRKLNSGSVLFAPR